MSSSTLSYAQLSPYQYQSFSVKTVKFTNIPLWEPKKSAVDDAAEADEEEEQSDDEENAEEDDAGE